MKIEIVFMPRGVALRFVIVIAASLSACATALPRVAIRGDEVLHHLDELANRNEVTLSTVRVSEHEERSEDRETVFLAQTVTVNGAPTTLEKALEGCGAFASAHPCRVDASTRIVLREISEELLAAERAAATRSHGREPVRTIKHHPVVEQVTGVLALIGFVGTIVCAGECSDPKLEATGLGVVTLALGVVALLVSDVRD